MCGGTLELNEGDKTAMCAYCGNRQTVPSVTDEVITNLFNRANNLRLKSEFDKAAEIYGKILNNDDKISEAHWGLVLCKYGIEYVEDPKTYRRIPTCHRTQYTSVLSDADYLAAIENADAVSRELYTAQAHEIAELQKSILAIVKDEKPFDVFICYKETDESGKRTVDSTIANDIYYQLTKEGLRVFYSAITLEDKLGVEYEPYIFAALNSAKVMLVIGTKPEYFEAVWVKNEWSRYLAIMKNDREKLLIPCYRDMDAYDLPEEFAHLQAQDMSKIGFINDVVRGIGKVVVKDEPKKETVVKEVVKETVTSSAASANPAPLLKRAFMFLEDGDWHSADEYAEKVLDIDPECAEGYLVKLMSELKVKARDDLKTVSKAFDNMGNYQKVIRFGSQELKNELNGYISYINEQNRLREQREKQARLTEIYNKGVSQLRSAKTEEDFRKAAKTFDSIAYFQDSAQKKKICFEEAKKAKNDATYEIACNILAGDYYENTNKRIVDLQRALEFFHSLNGWRDSAEKITLCEEKIEETKNALVLKKAEEERENREKAEAEVKRRKEKRKMCIIILALAVLLFSAFKVFNVTYHYHRACELMEEGRYSEAAIAFGNLGDYSDSAEKKTECIYRNACKLMEKGKYSEAAIAFGNLGDYKNAKEKSFELWDELVDRETISAGEYHTVALKPDGTVVATGYNYKGQCDVDDLTDIVAISAGDYHTVALKSDGTVVAVGANGNGQCDVDEWADIVAISAGDYHTVALKSDGTVVATGSNSFCQCDVGGWTDIVAISAGTCHTVALKSNGKVVAVGDNSYGQCDVGGWTDVVAISAGSHHTVSIRSNNTVVAVGTNGSGQCDVDEWSDVVAISTGYYHTVALKSDSSVITTCDNNYGQCDVDDWTDIVVISAGYSHTVGLKSDGTVVAVGYNGYGQCNVSSWSDIRLP